jgi:predicted transcriptional regulator
VLIFAAGIVATSWTTLNTRIRDLEVQVKILQVKTEQHESVINEVKSDLKDIKVLLHEIDKKLEHKQDRQ